MDQQLQRLIGELRKETCPPAVLEQVGKRLMRERSETHRWHHAVAWTAAMSCVVCALVFWQMQARREARLAARALVVQQTQGALTYIGQTLLEAAAHTESAILKEAVPPLRNSLETAKNKVTSQI